MRSRLVPIARRLGVVLGLLLVASMLAAPAHAAKPSSPKRFGGYAFDTCVSPSNEVMDAWNVASPYTVVGIYTSGNSRYCDESKQPHLSPTWVQRQASRGWLFLPIHVGYQAPCFDSKSSKKRMSYDLTRARAQARADADEAVRSAARYGFAKGNAVYLDIEWYDRTNARCSASVMTFIDAFVQRVHQRDYKVGLYSSASAAIQAVDEARHAKRSGFDFPDQMWFAWTNRKANTDGRPYLSHTFWRRDRLHQYHNNVAVSYGGRKVTIDKNVLTVGGGSRAKKEQKVCGITPTLKRYRGLKAGSRGGDVKLLQCLLKRAGHQATVTGRWNARTTKAVNSYRASLGWKQTSSVSRPLWTALLSRGKTPIALKRGKVGEPVHRLQRTLRAAGHSVSVTGIYDARTAGAVRAYRKNVGLPGYQTADRRVWAALQAGRR
ncbi:MULTISPECIES: glycoside hydrolase domain-containing protein [Aeromicrobium]|uniref:glycoside hydrolase domain-containing protein n=1 Tax=Aeromicrobium TaxID=2040 RepID=UPI00257D9A87|nr:MULTISPECIES: glycoside hydrolase domain-containing protein [Aeromicrobium]